MSKTSNGKKNSTVSFEMVPKRMVDLHARAAMDRHFSRLSKVPWNPKTPRAKFETAFGIEPIQDDAPPHRRDTRPDALTALVGATFDAAVPKETVRKLEHGQALAATIVVPSVEWVAPFVSYFEKRFGDRWEVHSRDGSNRRHDSSVGVEEVSRDLSNGMCVAGIASDIDLLPCNLVGAADIAIRLAAPDSPVVAEAIKRFARRAPPNVPEIVAALRLHQMIAAFRPGTGAAKIVARLTAMATALRADVAQERLPDLSTAVEYGEARTFALNLARDIEDYRKGLCDWKSLPKGVCLASEPGCGKSLLARSIARFCGDAPIVISSVADWFAKERSYIDDVIRSMRSVLDSASALARAHGICFLFLDEVDAIPDRASLDSRNRDYWLPIVADLLARLDDGTSSARKGVILIAATNNGAAVDRALLRPGRFERMINIERADAAGTLNMLKFHVNGALPDAELEEFALAMERSTGAEIMAFVREANRIARQAGRDLSAVDLRAALLNSETRPPDMDWRICVHEAGHVVTTLALGYGNLRHCVVNARIGIENRTLIEDDTGVSMATRQGVENRTTMLLAGRSAERCLLGANSAGGSGDETSDTGLAFSYIASLHFRWGLGDTISFFGSRNDAIEAARCDRTLRDIVEADLQRLQKRADGIVARHRAAVVAVAEALRDRRHLGGDELRRIFEANRPRSGRKAREKPACSS